MSREIKFRVWDKHAEKMGKVTGISFSNVQYNLVHYRYVDGRGKIIDEQSHIDDKGHGVIALMQFTGLKDKNGREIYEGDIVKSLMQESRGEWKDFERTGVVTYFKNYAQFLIKTNDNSLGFDLFQFDDTDDYEVLELEVIGNIYEDGDPLHDSEKAKNN